MKSKLRPIWRVALALALVLGLSLVTAVPAGAVATLNVIPFTVIDAGDGSAAWSTDQAKSGTCSVLLDAGTAGGANAGRVWIPVDPIPLADFTGASYYVWEPTGTQHGGEFPYETAHPYGDPYINFYLDLDNDGSWDECLEGLGSVAVPASGTPPATHPTPTPETWVQMEEGYGFYDGGNDLLQGTWIDAHNVGTLDGWKAYLATAEPDAEVVAVKITFGFWADEVTPDVYVDSVTVSGVTYDLEGTAADYTTITAAIAAANPDDTILVAAGGYTESVVVGTANLTIQGAGADVTTVSTPNAASSPFTIAESNVTIDGFTLTGCTAGSLGAINIDDTGGEISGGTISNNVITGNRAGIRLGRSSSGQGIDGVIIEGNAITENTYKAIWFWNAVDYGGQAVSNIAIIDNEITLNGSSGISTYGPGPYTITDNLVSGNAGNGISIKYDDGDVVSDNIVTDNDAMGINMHQVTNCVVENNTVSGHLSEDVVTTFWGAPISAGKGSGIYVHEASVGNTIRYNDITGNNNGILISRESAGDDPSANSIYYNNIAGNNYYGVRNALGGSPAPVDAKKNWWGDASGPDGPQVFGGEPGSYTSLLPGVGGRVSANVKCRPWLTRPFETVIEDDIAYFGISAPALKGWNIVSAPLALDAHVAVAGIDGVYATNTWGGLLNLGKIADGDKYALKLHYTMPGVVKEYTPIYYYDSNPDSLNFGWRQATGSTEINPLDAFYIRMKESDSIPILFSPDLSVPSKKLYQGWNLVGCAYMPVLTEEEGLALKTALATIAKVSSPAGDVKGYAQVVSPPVNQPSWIFIPPDTYIPPEAVNEKVLIGKGYWVFMENPGTLAGLTFTPISLP